MSAHPRARRARLVPVAAVAATTALLTGTGALAAAPAGADVPSAALPHSASTDSVAYRCAGPFGQGRLSISLDLTNVEDGAPTGLRLPRGMALDVSVDLPRGIFGAFGALGGLGDPGGLGGLGGLFGGGLGAGDLSGQLEDLTVGFAGRDLPLGDLTGEIGGTDSAPVLDTDGDTPPLTLPTPGDYDVTLPDSFTFSPFSLVGLQLFSTTCERVGGDVAEEVEVDEQESETDVEVLDPDETEADVPVLETEVVRELGADATGVVVARVGDRVVGRSTLRRGVARTALTRLPMKRQQVVVTYLGNKLTSRSSDAVRVGRR